MGNIQIKVGRATAGLLLALFCVVAHVSPMAAQASRSFRDRYYATYITMSQGLRHNYVDDIYKDSHGFLWIAMAGGGLSRYDGRQFVDYNPDTPDCPLKSNFVCSVAEDGFSRLWVATEGGLDVIDLATRKPLKLLSSHGATDSMATAPATAVLTDATGCVWVHSESRIVRMAFDDQGNIAAVHTMAAPPAMERQVVMRDVDGDGRVWAGLGDHLWLLSPADDGQLHESPVASCLNFAPGTVLNDIVGKEGEVWIATNNGLFRYNRQQNVVKLYEHNPADKASLSQNLVTALAVTADKQLIAANLRGLNIYDPIGDNFERVWSNMGSTGGAMLNSDFVNCMFVDDNHIWLGTESGGINKLSLKRLAVKAYINNPDWSATLSPNPVNAIYQDSDGTLWVGTVEGGLNRRPASAMDFEHFTSERGQLSHNSVSAIAEDADGRLWVGTWGGGVTLLDRRKPSRALEVVPAERKGPMDFVGALAYDKRNNAMWIGANEGIFYYDIAARHLYTAIGGGRVRGCIGAIVAEDGTLWMGCLEGACVIDLGSVTTKGGQLKFDYRQLEHKLDNPESGIGEKITCFCQSADGTLWLGSNGFGIYRRSVDEAGRETFRAYTTANGLASNSVRGIVEAKDGCLWVSTNNGLSRFDPASETVVNYGLADGLIDRQFYWNAACRVSSGNMYFGSMRGMIGVRGDLPPLPPAEPRMCFTRLLVDGEEVLPGGEILAKDISMTGALSLHESSQSFAVEFSPLTFDDGDAGTTYTYCLEGFDKRWHVLPPEQNVLTYTNLAPGNYKLLVRRTVSGNAGSVATAELQIEIVPYIYKRPWFVCLVLVVVVVGVWQAYRWRIRRLKRRSEELAQRVEERTREIATQKKLLEEKTAALSEQNKTLTEQNEKITQQKAQLTRMTNKIRELTFDRIAFFTNITHEFRTPLTLIIGPIERALKLSYNPQVIEQLHYVERNSKYLLSLVNQLMDFRKVESGKMQINVQRHNFVDFINELITPFDVFARERDIVIERFVRFDDPELSFDDDAMHKVLTNLLSNAIKFTPDGGRIRLYATLLRDGSDSPTLYIAVSDTGVGIPPEDIGKLFNRFFQSKGQTSFPMHGQSGSGIGLYLCRRIVQMHGGTINARNNPTQGCTMRILLPIAHKEATVGVVNTATQPLLPPQNAHKDDAHSAAMTVMVAEDNADMRSFMRSILEEKYYVVEASDGMEAMQLLEKVKVDFIVCDLMMPNMDGLELTRRVKGSPTTAHIPVLMLTARTSEEARTESYQVGVDGYLQKPFDESLLLTRMANILENRRRDKRQPTVVPELKDVDIEPENSERQFVERVMEVMKANYRNPNFDVDAFCEAMGNSRSYLNKKMHTLMGNSINQYIRFYRLNLARQLLKSQEGSGKSVADIAYKVGFNDPKYFSRCFQAQFGVKPNQVMRKGRES